MKHSLVQIYFSLEKNNIFLSILLLFFLAACVSKNNDFNQTSRSCIPRIIVETLQDSLRIGEVFEAKLYFSDTAYLTVYDSMKGKGVRYYPVFKINDRLINNNFSDYLLVRDTVDSEIIYKEFPNYREVNVSVIFPHPLEGEGTVELSKIVSYSVIE